MAPLATGEMAQMLGGPAHEEEIYSEGIAAFEVSAGESMVSQTLQFLTQLYLQDDILAKVDRTSMGHGLEVRSPFLDRDLVTFVSKLPNSQKFHRGRTKVILKRALASVLPAAICERSKMGFGIPQGLGFETRTCTGAQHIRRSIMRSPSGTSTSANIGLAERIIGCICLVTRCAMSG